MQQLRLALLPEPDPCEQLEQHRKPHKNRRSRFKPHRLPVEEMTPEQRMQALEVMRWQEPRGKGRTAWVRAIAALAKASQKPDANGTD